MVSGLWQEVARPFQRVGELGEVELHILLVQVHRLDGVPAFLVHIVWMLDVEMVSRVELSQRALVEGDIVLHVVDIHVLGWILEGDTGEPFEPPEWHHLDEHGAAGEEHHVGEAGAMDAHHHVGGVDEAREVGHVGVVVRLGDAHVEPGERGGVRHGALVEEAARALAGDDEEARLVAPRRARARRDGALQAEGAAEEALEVGDGDAARGARRVDAHGAVERGADEDPREAVHLLVVVDVDDVVPGELPEQRRELVEPPILDPAEQELHLAAEVVGAGEERDEHVGVVMVQVAGEAAAGEEERRDGVVARAERRHGAVVGAAEGDERELPHVVHGDGVVEARVRLGPPLLVERVDVDLGVVAVDADVAHGGAPLRPLARDVARRPGRVEVLLPYRPRHLVPRAVVILVDLHHLHLLRRLGEGGGAVASLDVGEDAEGEEHGDDHGGVAHPPRLGAPPRHMMVLHRRRALAAGGARRRWWFGLDLKEAKTIGREQQREVSSIKGGVGVASRRVDDGEAMATRGWWRRVVGRSSQRRNHSLQAQAAAAAAQYKRQSRAGSYSYRGGDE